MSHARRDFLACNVFSAQQINPIAGVVMAAFDAAIAFVVLGVMFAVTGTAPSAIIYWLPVVMFVQVLFVLTAASTNGGTAPNLS